MPIKKRAVLLAVLIFAMAVNNDRWVGRVCHEHVLAGLRKKEYAVEVEAASVQHSQGAQQDTVTDQCHSTRDLLYPWLIVKEYSLSRLRSSSILASSAKRRQSVWLVWMLRPVMRISSG